MRVGYSLLLVFLSKAVATDWLYKVIYVLPPDSEYEESNLRQHSGLPNTCQVLAGAGEREQTGRSDV